MRRFLAVGLLLAGCEASTDTLELGAPPPSETMEPEPRCEIVGYEARVNLAGEASTTVRVDGRRVFFDDRDPSTTDIDVRIVDVDTGERTALAGSGNEILIDARAGGIAYASDERTGLPGSFHLLHANGEQPTQIAEILIGYANEYSGGENAVVSDRSITWWDRGAVHRWFDGETIRHDFVTLMSPPHFNEGRIVLGDRVNEFTTEIWMHDDEQAPQLVTRARNGGIITSVRYSDGKYFWIDDGRLERFDPATEQTEVLHPGPCGPPDVDGGRAVAACDHGTAPAFPAPGSFLVYFDGETATALFEDGGYHYAPRIDDGRIAWIRYTSTDALCGGGPGAPGGEIRFYDPDAGFDPLVVAEAGAPCLCCDAYWPPAQISFAGDVLAWNYAPPDEADPQFGGVGYAVIDTLESCSTPSN